MGRIPRKSDGRRVYTPEFKREQIERVLRGELTLSELSRELDISRGLLQRWKSLLSSGAEAAVKANEEVVPASELKAALAKIRELERLIGKQGLFYLVPRRPQDLQVHRPRIYGVSKK